MHVSFFCSPILPFCLTKNLLEQWTVEISKFSILEPVRWPMELFSKAAWGHLDLRPRISSQVNGLSPATCQPLHSLMKLQRGYRASTVHFSSGSHCDHHNDFCDGSTDFLVPLAVCSDSDTPSVDSDSRTHRTAPSWERSSRWPVGCGNDDPDDGLNQQVLKTNTGL